MTNLTKRYLDLSVPTTFKNNFQSTAKSFSTNILIIGGSYSGLSTLRSLQLHLSKHINAQKSPKKRKVSITLVEPRDGLLNILGIPKCIVDLEFAESQYVKFCSLNNCKFTNILSSNKGLGEDDGELWIEGSEDNGLFEINYVQGKVTYLDQFKAQYHLNGDVMDKGIIEFDYVVLCSGRDRNWPTTPISHCLSDYLDEMKKAKSQIEDASTITVIGAGAVGIEIAGDIKTKYPAKTVNLIHPHESFPPEPLSIEFKNTIQESIETAGINIYLNTRIKHQLPNSTDLLTTSDKVISSDLNIWTNSKSNNTNFLSSEFTRKFITPSKNISVNQYLQLSSESDTTYENFFVLGDLVDLPIIKSAGWAMFMGRQTANNITNLIFNGEVVEPLPDLKNIPFGMVLIGGNNEIVSELCGEVEVDNEHYVQEYQDYCIGKVRATLDM
ncbi:hypothetical protein G210_1224 [Candida maltosa Xu316]|uniref:FAD/NAD(P)-binding domain-containing protein n=1 Tax=Candida maltosa (strain Xu316) TaxID=1245528 RepID=M3HLD9_CANMX|nr:hypothetical protein G210_1224 [Candida maltosa Xu316]